MKIESTILSLSIYLTDVCNLNCKHCFLKASPRGKQHLSWEQIKTTLDYYRQQNCQIVEFTGGEACLSPFVRRAVTYARKIGYPSIGINTNGITSKVIDLFSPQELDKITFSLDGATPNIHDIIRGQGSFKKTIATINQAITLGFNVEVIFTVNRYNQNQTKTIVQLLDKMKVTKLSFNYISPIGNAQQNPDVLLSPKDWIKVRSRIESINNLKFLTIRYPPMFVSKTEYNTMITQGYHCVLANASKNEVRPDGNIYHCCLTVENPQVVGGHAKNNHIILDKKEEINYLELHYNSPCPARVQSPSPDLIPICVYYKKIIEPQS